MSKEFARRELDILEKACKSKDGLEMQKEVTKDILELLDVFEKQGHSGFSASYVVNLFKDLVNYKPLSPLTGEDDEWADAISFGPDDPPAQLNKRCHGLFRKNYDNSTARYMDDIIFSDNGGITWFTCESKAQKYRKPIKFPWMPPTEPRRIYIKYAEDVPLGETSDDFIDITDNPEEIERLYKKFRDLEKEWEEEEEEKEDDNDK